MWIENLTEKLDRKKTEITFSPHLFGRKEYWNLDLDKIEETVRSGKICQKPPVRDWWHVAYRKCDTWFLSTLGIPAMYLV